MTEDQKPIELTEEPQPAPRPKPAKRVPVTVVSKARQTALVEWRKGDDLARAYVPVNVIDERGTIAEDELALGVRYGVPWEELLTVNVTPADVARELRRRGIWVSGDLRGRSQVHAAFNRLLKADLDAMLRAARHQEDTNATK